MGWSGPEGISFKPWCLKASSQDLIIDILHRLSAKSLGRFRCVSKDWQSLLSEPRFIKTHQKTINRNHLILVNNRSLYSLTVNYHETLSRPKEVDLLTHHPSDFYGSCNGLVLASGVYGDIVVFNPTTRDFVRLQKCEKDDMVYGFGYDSVTDDYKVVVMPCSCYYSYDFFGGRHLDLENRVDVYSLRTNAWRQAINSSSAHNYRKNSSGVLVNGFLHWIGRKGCHSPVIVAFSLADEKFIELSSPKDVIISETKFEGNLVVLGEKLAIFNELKGDIWLMNEYGVRSSWTKIVIHGFNGSPMVREEMLFYDDGKIMFLQRNRMMLYNIEERTFCKSFVISYMAFPEFKCAYVESLVSPKFSLTKINKRKRR